MVHFWFSTELKSLNQNEAELEWPNLLACLFCEHYCWHSRGFVSFSACPLRFLLQSQDKHATHEDTKHHKCRRMRTSTQNTQAPHLRVRRNTTNAKKSLTTNMRASIAQTFEHARTIQRSMIHMTEAQCVLTMPEAQKVAEPKKNYQRIAALRAMVIL